MVSTRKDNIEVMSRLRNETDLLTKDNISREFSYSYSKAWGSYFAYFYNVKYKTLSIVVSKNIKILQSDVSKFSDLCFENMIQ